jgi:CubicO group peptidase (beta-lactamase class C family)
VSSLAVRFLRFALSAIVGAIALCATVATPALAASPELTATNLAGVIDPLMEEWIARHRGPGAVVVVVNRDGPVFARGYGLADIAANRPFTADATLVRPGSISKLFTGIAVMQLVDAGKLDLDRDVNAYIDFVIPVPEGGVAVTLRRLLTHRAGFEDHLKGLFSRDREPAPIGPWLAKNLPQRLFPNGDVEAYSNYGFTLAGYIVERVSGEAFASYVQQHILDPLDMKHSTFRQPLPDDLAPLMAKAYRRSDQPPLMDFETIPAPAGALSATGADMGRFMRALLNGGELDGVRILSKARLDEMMKPESASSAGYLGLAFFGTKVADRNAIGHDGETLAFFSSLKLFTEQGIGIFVSRDGIGEIGKPQEIPAPTATIARRFLPPGPRAANAAAAPGDAAMAGVYQISRRADSVVTRLDALTKQFVIKIGNDGNPRLLAAVLPFGDGAPLRRLGGNLYLLAGNHIAFVDDPGAESYLVQPALRMQRVPWFLDARWIALAFVASTAVILLTLTAWPLAALWRRWRKRRWSEAGADRRGYLAVRLVLLIDLAVIAVVAVLFAKTKLDPTILNDALDPVLLAIYVLAWLGVFGAILALWVAARFWRSSAGSRWSRVHHSLIAASCVMIAWFFVTFHIAGTTLNY